MSCFMLTRKKHFKYARLWNGALRIMQNRGNNAKASRFHQKMAPGLGENIDKMIETWNPGRLYIRVTAPLILNPFDLPKGR